MGRAGTGRGNLVYGQSILSPREIVAGRGLVGEGGEGRAGQVGQAG